MYLTSSATPVSSTMPRRRRPARVSMLSSASSGSLARPCRISGGPTESWLPTRSMWSSEPYAKALGQRGRSGLRHAAGCKQDLTAQRNGLHALGVGDDRIYVDHGLTGTNRDRPGLRLALAACRSGDTFVVTKLDRLARSLPDARDILDELTKRNVKL